MSSLSKSLSNLKERLLFLKKCCSKLAWPFKYSQLKPEAATYDSGCLLKKMKMKNKYNHSMLFLVLVANHKYSNAILPLFAYLFMVLMLKISWTKRHFSLNIDLNLMKYWLISLNLGNIDRSLRKAISLKMTISH